MSRTEKRNLLSDLKTVIILIPHQGVVGDYRNAIRPSVSRCVRRSVCPPVRLSVSGL